MTVATKIKWTSYFLSVLVLIFSFILFYRDTQQPLFSLAAAVLSAVLTLISCLMLGWLIQVFWK